MRSFRCVMIGSCLSAIMLFSAGGIVAQQAPKALPAPKVVAYCELASHQKVYDHGIVQTEGIFKRGQESWKFYSPLCLLAEQTSWVDYSDDLRHSTSPELIDKMEKLLDSAGRVKLTVVLEFDGPKKVGVPADTPPKVADLMRSVNSRYGHLNQFSSRVLFLKILAVDPVPENGAAESKPGDATLLHESGHVDPPNPQ